MYNAEKKTILSVLALYLTSSILLVFLFANTYYEHEKEKLQKEEKHILLSYAKDIYLKLEEFHNKLEGKFIYPRFNNFQTAIYDIDKNEIYSTLINKKIDFTKNFYYMGDYSYYIHGVMPYYLGTAYIVIEMQDYILLKSMGKNIFILTTVISQS